MHNPVKVIMCPACEQKFRNKSVIYWFDQDGIQWSDGYRSNDISHEIPLITRCDECYSYFWIAPVHKPLSLRSKLVRLELNPLNISPGQQFRPVRKLTPEEFAEVLAMKNYKGAEEEIYLRKHLWWTINDQHRKKLAEVFPPDLQAMFEENLETLIFKTTPDCHENCTEIAEMHRELGQFSEAEKYLNRIKNGKGGILAGKIRQKVAENDRKVFMV